MAHTLTDLVLKEARTIIADRRRRLRGTEAVTAMAKNAIHAGMRPSAFAPSARSFAQLTRSRATARLRIGLGGSWRVRWLAANLRRIDEDEPGWSLAMLSDPRGQAAVLRAIDTLIGQRRA